ncbi:carbonic anhydrase [Streptomyces nojiriensis]|uniref:carbonic anhydrase n=1 Tax=Streptomyces nojiriensis TaxID=66374 RepID=UPI003646E88B
MTGAKEGPELARMAGEARGYPGRAAALGIELTDLSDGQHPRVVVVACSDARLVPALITGSRPGEVLELRTHGGLVPRFDPELPTGEALTIEYAVTSLPITDIVVLGHSHCEVVDIDVADTLEGDAGQDLWTTGDFTAAGHSHVLRQLDVLSDYACIAPRVADGSLRVHAWYHELGTGATLCFRPDVGAFLPL